jgi:hypothetical protein
VGGRLAVGDHDDLLGAGLLREQLAGEHEAVLHVGAVHEVPAHLGQLRGGELAGHLAEADDAQVVARELRRDQRVQRHRHLLGGQEVVAHRHRQRQVEHQHRGRADECSVRSISKSSGDSRTGVPPPCGAIALRMVRSMWRLNGSPNS